MHTFKLLSFLASSLFIGQAMAIEPVYEGENGIRATIFAPHCLACHSSEKTGDARNNAPSAVDYDSYTAAVASGNGAVMRAVTMMNMPPAFSPLDTLNDEQKQALKNWQALGFPEHVLPAIYNSADLSLSIPKVFIKDDNGDIVQKLTVEMQLLAKPGPIQFELTDFHAIDHADSDSAEHDHSQH